MKMPKNTKQKMNDYALTLKPSSARAQCYTIANYTLNEDETIAERLYRDHSSQDGHLRAARLMVFAGCATEKVTTKNCYGVFAFEDASSF